MKTNYISRNDAASILGVTPQTISNYIERGLLKSKRNGSVNTFVTVSEDSVLELLEKEKEIGVNNDEVQKHLAELAVSLKRSEEEEKSIREYLCDLGGLNIQNILPDLLSLFVNDDEGSRNMVILKMLMERCTVSEIADYMGLTRERVRQNILSLLMKLSKNVKSYSDIRNENENLKIENDRLKFEVESLKQQNMVLISESNNGRITKESSESELAYKLSKQTIRNSDLSVRAIHCLLSGEIETVYDLVRRNRSEILRYRNMGKKTMVEIDEFLESNNLSFGMDI